MISRCCCLLWLNTQTESVCNSVCVCASLRPVLPSRLPESSTCSPLKNALHPVGWQEEVGPTNTMHTPCCRAEVHPVNILFSSSVLFWCLNGWGGSRQLGRTHVDHDAGGDEYGGLRDAFQSPISHCVTSTLFGDMTKSRLSSNQALQWSLQVCADVPECWPICKCKFKLQHSLLSALFSSALSDRPISSLSPAVWCHIASLQKTWLSQPLVVHSASA